QLLAEALTDDAGIASAEIAGPGFLNIRVAAGAQGEIARQVLEGADSYGHAASTGRSINMEFISANPTGPLHLGHTRWAAVGDAMARVLRAGGNQVSNEFYINDRGSQMDKFGASLMARAHGPEPPEGGYHGAYVVDLARQIIAEDPAILDLPEAEQSIAFREAGYARQLAEHQSQLEGFNTHFNVWFSERSLHASDAVEQGMSRLREQGRL